MWDVLFSVGLIGFERCIFLGDDFKSHLGLMVLDFRSTVLSKVSLRTLNSSPLFQLFTHTPPRGCKWSFSLLSTHVCSAGAAAACSCGLSRPTVAHGSSPSLPQSQVCKAVAIEMDWRPQERGQNTTCSGEMALAPAFQWGRMRPCALS